MASVVYSENNFTKVNMLTIPCNNVCIYFIGVETVNQMPSTNKEGASRNSVPAFPPAGYQTTPVNALLAV